MYLYDELVTKFQAITMLTHQVMDCQVHAIGKAIQPLFAYLITSMLHDCIS